MVFPAIIGAVASIAGAKMGADAAQSAADKQAKALSSAKKLFQNIDIPDIEKQKLVLEQLASQGEYTPEMLEAMLSEGTAMEDIAVDPRLAAQQMASLESISQIAEQGGLTPSDLAALEQARRSADASARARQGAIVQELQQRGQGGAGVELATRLQAAQEASDRQAQASLEQTKMALERQMAANTQAANLASGIRGQEYGEQSDLARARDVINQFNLQNQQRVRDTNVQSRNQAQAANLSERQRIADQNVGLSNQQQQYNKQLQQQQFENQMNRGRAIAGQQGLQASNYGQQAANTAAMGATIGQGVGNIFGSIAQSQKDDKNYAQMNNYIDALKASKGK